MTEHAVLSRKPVPCNSLRAPDVFSVVMEDGSTAYYNPRDGYFDVDSYNLGFLIVRWIDRLRAMVRLLYDPDHAEFCDNMEILLDAFDKNVDEAVYTIMNDIGLITCHLAGDKTGCRLRGRVVGVEFEPAVHHPEGRCVDGG